jgi:hypothetical protein
MTEENTMEVPTDPEERQAWMLDLLINHYGVRGNVIDPDTQLNIPDLPVPKEQPDKGGKQEARVLKQNDRLYDVIAYLQEHHGLFLQGSLYIDCPIHPWFGKTPKKDQGIYRAVFRIIPREHGYLAFTCRKDCRCEWRECPIHPSVPFFQQRFDPFDLLQVLDSIKEGYRYPNRYGRIADYTDRLVEAFGVDTKKLRAEKGLSHEGMGRYKGMWHSANKNQLMIEITFTVPSNDEEVEAFIARVARLIFSKEPEPVFEKTESAITVWFPDSSYGTIKKLGGAARLWLYLWIRQQEERGRVVAEPKEFAAALGVNVTTIYRYRDQLENEGKLTRKQGRAGAGKSVETWTVKA